MKTFLLTLKYFAGTLITFLGCFVCFYIAETIYAPYLLGTGFIILLFLICHWFASMD